jgi:hypothetical protein
MCVGEKREAIERMKRIKERRCERTYSSLNVNGCIAVVDIQTHVFTCTYVV